MDGTLNPWKHVNHIPESSRSGENVGEKIGRNMELERVRSRMKKLRLERSLHVLKRYNYPLPERRLRLNAASAAAWWSSITADSVVEDALTIPTSTTAASQSHKWNESKEENEIEFTTEGICIDSVKVPPYEPDQIRNYVDELIQPLHALDGKSLKGKETSSAVSSCFASTSQSYGANELNVIDSGGVANVRKGQQVERADSNLLNCDYVKHGYTLYNDKNMPTAKEGRRLYDTPIEVWDLPAKICVPYLVALQDTGALHSLMCESFAAQFVEQGSGKLPPVIKSCHGFGSGNIAPLYAIDLQIYIREQWIAIKFHVFPDVVMPRYPVILSAAVCDLLGVLRSAEVSSRIGLRDELAFRSQFGSRSSNHQRPQGDSSTPPQNMPSAQLLANSQQRATTAPPRRISKSTL